MSEDMHEAVFVWPEVDANEVIMTGTFDQWSRSMHLTKTPGGFEGKIKLPWGSHVQYKYIVDGKWTTAQSQPEEPDGHGNLNNVYECPSKPETVAKQEQDAPVPTVSLAKQPEVVSVAPTEELKAEGKAETPQAAQTVVEMAQETLAPVIDAGEKATSAAVDAIHQVADKASVPLASTVAAVAAGVGLTTLKSDEDEKEVTFSREAEDIEATNKAAMKDAQKVLDDASLVTAAVEAVPATPGEPVLASIQQEQTVVSRTQEEDQSVPKPVEAPVVETSTVVESEVIPVLPTSTVTETQTPIPSETAQNDIPKAENTEPVGQPIALSDGLETSAAVTEDIVSPTGVEAKNPDIADLTKEDSMANIAAAASETKGISPTDKALTETAVETLNADSLAVDTSQVLAVTDVTDTVLDVPPVVQEEPNIHITEPAAKVETASEELPTAALDTSLEKGATAPGPADASVSPVAASSAIVPAEEKASQPETKDPVATSSTNGATSEGSKVIATPKKSSTPPPKTDEPKQPNGGVSAAGTSSTAFPRTDDSPDSPQSSSRFSTGRFGSIRKKRASIFGKVKNLFSHGDKEEKERR